MPLKKDNFVSVVLLSKQPEGNRVIKDLLTTSDSSLRNFANSSQVQIILWKNEKKDDEWKGRKKNDAAEEKSVGDGGRQWNMARH